MWMDREKSSVVKKMAIIRLIINYIKFELKLIHFGKCIYACVCVSERRLYNSCWAIQGKFFGYILIVCWILFQICSTLSFLHTMCVYMYKHSVWSNQISDLPWRRTKAKAMTSILRLLPPNQKSYSHTHSHSCIVVPQPSKTESDESYLGLG